MPKHVFALRYVPRRYSLILFYANEAPALLPTLFLRQQAIPIFNNPTRGEMAHRVISTVLNVVDEIEWKVQSTVRKSAVSGEDCTWLWTSRLTKLSSLIFL